MERFARAYADAHRRRRAELQVQPAGSERHFSVELLGLQSGGKMIIVTAPANADRSLIAVRPGHALTCRWLNPSTVFQFEVSITKLVFEPIPMLYLGDPHAIKVRELRGLPRARAALPASLRTPAPLAALVTDLSVGGAQVGVTGGPPLKRGQEVELALRAKMFQKDFVLNLGAKVATDQGTLDPAHPEITFYGLTFTDPPEVSQLVLHGLVHEHLAREADRLAQLLLSAANSGTGAMLGLSSKGPGDL
jgi:hypothetical protein